MPMPVVSLVGIGARILRRHLRVLLTVAVLVQLPGAIIDAVAQQRLAESVSPLFVGLDTDAPRILTPTDAQTSEILGALGVVASTMMLSMLLGAVATVAYATVVSRDYHAVGTTLREVLGIAARRSVAAVAAVILGTLAVLAVIAVTTLLAVGSVVLLPTGTGEAGGLGIFLALVIGVGGAALAGTLLVRLCLATIAVALEGIGPVTAVRRSWHLTGSNTWRTLGLLVLVTIIVSIVGSVLVRLLGVLVTDTIGTWLGDPLTVDGLVAASVAVLLAPVAVVVQTALYFDLRVRRDGWDVPLPAGADDGLPNAA